MLSHLCHFLLFYNLVGLLSFVFSLVLNPQIVTPFDVAIPLFPQFVQPNLGGSIHVDSLATSSENVVILNDLFNTK